MTRERHDVTKTDSQNGEALLGATMTGGVSTTTSAGENRKTRDCNDRNQKIKPSMASKGCFFFTVFLKRIL